MPCLPAIIALITPRILIGYLWLFTQWFAGVYATLLWPILGFIFAPTVFLWYTFVQKAYAGEWGTFQIVVLVLAILIDMSPGAGKKKKK